MPSPPPLGGGHKEEGEIIFRFTLSLPLSLKGEGIQAKAHHAPLRHHMHAAIDEGNIAGYMARSVAYQKSGERSYIVNSGHFVTG